MAGLLSFLGLGDQGAPGVLPMGQQPSTGWGGVLGGIDSNRNMLQGLAAGLLSGQPTLGQGFGAGLQQAGRGRLLDEAEQDRRKKQAGDNATAAWLKTKNLDPNIASALAANPELAQQYFVSAITPKANIKLGQGEELLSGDDPSKVLARGMPKPVATPDDLQGYAMYSQQAKASGQNPVDFLTYKQTIGKSSASVVNIDQRSQDAFEIANAKNQADRYNTLAGGYQPATEALSKLQTLKDISSRLTTGKTAEVQQALGPYVEALGLKVDGLGDQQAYNSVIQSIIPSLHVAGSGSTSDRDAASFAQSLPRLGNTPEGNAIITDTLQSMAEYKQAAADIGSRVVSKELTPQQGEQALRALPDPYARYKGSMGAAAKGGAGSAPVRKVIGGKTYEQDPGTGKVFEVTP